MTLQIVLLLLVILAALVLFSLERMPADVIAIGILLTLILAGLVPPEVAFAGFGSDTVIMIFGLLVLTAALVNTGVVDIIGRELLNLTNDKSANLLPVIMVTAALLSGFISNTATTALFVPITLSLAARTKICPSKLLMPLAFSSILASSVTLVGTSTNIVISGIIQQYGMEPLRMFELTAVGVPVAVMGIIYLLVLGEYLIPDRSDPDTSGVGLGIRPYLAEVLVLENSPLIGKTLAESGLGRDLDLTILRVIRGGNRYLIPQAKLILKQDDELLVKGNREKILKVKDTVGIAIKADIKLSDPRLQTDEVQLAEIILLPRSPLTGRTLKTLRFRQRYGIQVLGVNRRGKNIYRKLSQTRLRTGDQLLIQGQRANIAALDADNYHIIGPVEHQSPNRKRAPITIAIFTGVLLLAALNIVSLPVAVLTGTLGVFITRSITPDEAYREVSWNALIVIGSMLALGQAMEYTGTAELVATWIAGITVNANPLWLLTTFFALTMVLTQPMSNQAAAVVVLPIALRTAMQLGLNPRTFAVMIAVGASCSFITPLEPACLLVYGPGGYKFIDFVKAGAGLTLLVYGIAILMVPWIWPLGI
ncbi:MAG: SLC13 family permease [Anaerolineae bacterium]|nr:SLC13 family permease [Anaerolineae bacterium]